MYLFLKFDDLKSSNYSRKDFSDEVNFLCLLYQQDVTAKILDLMEGKPDLIIGNYSDGNLAATLMAGKLGITQVILTISTHKVVCSLLCIILNWSATQLGHNCSCFREDQV